MIFKRQAKIKHLREAAKIVSEILLEIQSLTKPDINLDHVDEIVARRIKKYNCTSINKGFHPKWSKVPYPSTICAAVNEEVCHAPPAGKILREGDIVTYDFGLKYKTGCGDAALTVAVGEIDNRKKRLMRYSKEALYKGIEVIKAGIPVSEIGIAINRHAVMNGYNVIRQFGGHHIGSEMHEAPTIPHWTCTRCNDILKEGKVVCLEPMLVPGQAEVGIMGTDKWTVFTLSEQPVAMWEHMILIKENSYEILTTHFTNSHEQDKL